MFIRPRSKAGTYRAEASVSKGPRTLSESKSFETKAAAKLWAEAKEDEFRKQLNGGFPDKTVRELLEHWRDTIAPTNGGAKWDINRINAILVDFTETLGGLDAYRLADFGPREMASFRRLRLGQVTPPTVHRGESLLRRIWADARSVEVLGWTDVDPFKDLKPIKGSSGQARNRHAKWTELKRVLRQLGYHPRRPATTKTAQVGLAAMVALRTTLRSQEVLSLSDEAVDLDNLVIQIEQHKTRYITNRAKRVPLLPKALLLLSRKCLGQPGPYFTVANASRDTLFRNARKACNVVDLTFHDLKRTSLRLLKHRLTKAELMVVTSNADEDVLAEHYLLEVAAEAATMAWKALGADKAAMMALAAKRRDGGASLHPGAGA